MCFTFRNSVVEYLLSFTEDPHMLHLGSLEESRIQPRLRVLWTFGHLHYRTIYTSDLRVLGSQGTLCEVSGSAQPSWRGHQEGSILLYPTQN